MVSGASRSMSQGEKLSWRGPSGRPKGATSQQSEKVEKCILMWMSILKPEFIGKLYEKRKKHIITEMLYKLSRGPIFTFSLPWGCSPPCQSRRGPWLESLTTTALKPCVGSKSDSRRKFAGILSVRYPTQNFTTLLCCSSKLRRIGVIALTSK